MAHNAHMLRFLQAHLNIERAWILKEQPLIIKTQYDLFMST